MVWDIIRHNELEKIIRELYQIEPRIFSNLNKEQKKTFVHLINLVMEQGERDELLEVLRHIVDLTPDDIRDLAQVLKNFQIVGDYKNYTLNRRSLCCG